jgi:hypothetical protein
MAEAEAGIEVHGGHEGHMHEAHESSRFGKAIAMKVSLIGVILAVVTIGSHRAHTAAVIHRTESNDQWSYYQAKRNREYLAQYALDTIPLLPNTDKARTQELLERYSADVKKYKSESAEIEKEGDAADARCKTEESRALYLDTSEGFFELGLVLSSLFFLSKRALFPIIGALSAVVGAVFGVIGFFFLA